MVLKLTFHLSLISFARSGHCLGAATQGFWELLNPRAQAVGQTHCKPSINVGAGLMGWAAHGSTSWEIFFMMLWKPRIDSRLEGEARISHPWRDMMQLSALTESPMVRPQGHFLSSGRHRLSYKGKGSILQNQKRNCSKVGWFFNNRGKIMQPWSTWEWHTRSTEKVQNIIAKNYIFISSPSEYKNKWVNRKQMESFYRKHIHHLKVSF